MGAVARTTGRHPAVHRHPARDGRSQCAEALVSPDGTKVVLGGNFKTVNGSTNPGYGLAMLYARPARCCPMPVNNLIRNGRENAAITNLESTADGFYGAGYAFGRQARELRGTFKADWNGNLIWVEDCHGDTYSAFPAGDDVYVAGHPHYCGNVGGFPQTEPTWTFQRGLAFTDDVRGMISRDTLGYFNFEGQPRPALLTWFPDINSGTFTGQSQGPWSIAATTTTSSTAASSPRSTTGTSRAWCGSPDRTRRRMTAAPG